MVKGPSVPGLENIDLAATGSVRINAPPEAALALALTRLAAAAGVAGCLHVARSDSRAERLAQAARSFAPRLDVLVLPAWDCLPYDRVSPSPAVMGQRIDVLGRLARPPAPSGRLLLISAEALLQRLPPSSICSDGRFAIEVGQPVRLEELRTYLLRSGYVLDERVDEPGEAAIRGTIDVFPGAADQPIRVRLDGDIVITIDRYDAITQRTEADTHKVALHPVSEVLLDERDVRRFLGEADDSTAAALEKDERWRANLLLGTPDAPRRMAALEHWLPLFHDRLQTVFDLLPGAAVVLDPEVEDRCRAWLDQIAEGYRHRSAILARQQPGSLPPLAPLPHDRLYLSFDEWSRNLQQRRVLMLTEDTDGAIDPGAASVPRFAEERDPPRALAAYVETRRDNADRVILAWAETMERQRLVALAERRLGTPVTPLADWTQAGGLPPGAIAAANIVIPAGFAVPGWVLIAFADVFAQAATRAAPAVTATPVAVFASDGLRSGDLVVHAEHGIGRVLGLERIDGDGIERECLSLAYAQNQKLLVPAEEIGSIWRYGSAETEVALDRLAGDAWAARKAEVEAELEETARALIELAAARQHASAPRLKASGSRYRRFAATFPYAETPDQTTTIAAVLRDLGSGRPMNRLVCGDVGFGKTEVALRAIAAAVFSGKQAAVIAPTTVLVRQHLETFRRRFAEFDIRVDALWRTSRTAASRAVIKAVADGSVDILIGTQAIASAALSFHDLGLVVIDEEQRFGQRQKEQLRRLRSGAHVLTMTATPIPRTLQSALAGVIDLSLITTPPVRRRPIRTFVMPFDAAIAREALQREQMQGGQSFVVCPRIADLEPMRQRLEVLVPELDVAVAHGRMNADVLDQTMLAFADGVQDVLLTTNIIESGLDIPSANTMLVWRPDRFGLADLHQLRGRVGRGRRRGMIYLLTNPQTPLPAATEKRLQTMQALEGLGAGFAIGARDLDLRGAGDLLGADQSGHVRLIGTGLYQDLLQHALRRVRGEADGDDWVADIRIGMGVVIPESYVPEEDVRIGLYRRLSRLTRPEETDDIADEITDRFGPMPDAVRDAIDLAGIRSQCHTADITKVEAGPTGIAMTFADENARSRAEKTSLEGLGATKWAGDRLVLQIATETPRERIEVIRKAIDLLPGR